MRRQHYMTLCIRNTEVTYLVKDTSIEVTFEQSINKGFNELILDIENNIIKNDGFNESDIAYYKRFLENNRACIIEEIEMELNNA